MNPSTNTLSGGPLRVEEQQTVGNGLRKLNEKEQIGTKLASLSLSANVSSSATSVQFPVSVSGSAVDSAQLETQMYQLSSNESHGQFPQKLKGLINASIEQIETKEKTREPNEADQQEEEKRVVLEDYTQCSKSHLWKLMMSFYDRKGVDSWSEGIVPFFITSNRFIGSAYAKIVRGFIKDCLENQKKKMCNNTLQKKTLLLNEDEPLYIVELGAGSGKFTYFMLQALVDMEGVLDIPLRNIKYIMTDFTEQNFNFWKNHPNLKDFFDRGLLDCGLFNAVVDDEIKLYFSGKTLKSGEVANPMIIVANYLFDTLCHDVFQISDNTMKEGLISVGSKGKPVFKKVSGHHQKKKPSLSSSVLDTEGIADSVGLSGTREEATSNTENTTAAANDTTNPTKEISNEIHKKETLIEPDPLDPDIIKRFANKYKYVPITDYNQYYSHEKDPQHNSKEDEEHLANILRWYHAYFGTNLKTNASILYPIGALRAIRKLSNLTNGRLLIISGDKGNNNPNQFVGLVNPHLAIHGSFSVMVNYHAIGLYCLSRGGFSLHNPQEDASLKVSCFLLTGNAPNTFIGKSSALINQEKVDCELTAKNIKTSTEEEKHIEDFDLKESRHEKGMYDNMERKEEEELDSKLIDNGQVHYDTEIPSKEETKKMKSIYETGGNVDLESLTRAENYPHLIYEFQNEIENFGPNDFFILQKSLKEDSANPSLRTIIALLKLSGWDPDIFYKFRDAILNQAPIAGTKLKNDLIRGIPKIWTNYFMLDKDKDIAFEIGRFYYGIKEFHLALKYYEKSAVDIGEHHVTFHNMGLCYYSINNLEKALEYFSKALKFNKKYEKARSWHEKVCTELGINNSVSGGTLLKSKSNSVSSTPLFEQDPGPSLGQDSQENNLQQEGGPAISNTESSNHTR